MAGDERLARVDAIFGETMRVHGEAGRACGPALLAAVDALVESLSRGGKALIFGNGGSAADAQHFACELVGRFLRERPAAGAIALTTDTSILTAVGNDYGFDRVFARQVEALGRPGDVAIGLSTSGRSANVLAALEAAASRGLRTIAMTGHDGGPIGRAVEIHLNVACDVTPRVQEVQHTQMHAICELVESELRIEELKN